MIPTPIDLGPTRVAIFPAHAWSKAQIAVIDKEWRGQPHRDRCVRMTNQTVIARISKPGTWPDIRMYSDPNSEVTWAPVADVSGTPTGDVSIAARRGDIECFGISIGDPVYP